MSIIIPAILPYSAEEYYGCLNAIDHAVDCIHLDIADGRFVADKTWSDADAIQDATAIEIELHLMVKDAFQGVKIWAEIPQVRLANVHAESVNLERAVKQLRNWKKNIRIALNPETPVNSIVPFLNQINGVLFMTVHPGKQGQPFQDTVIEKIAGFHAKYPDCPIAVDGHVDETTIPKLLAAGATSFCVGSAIFHSKKSAEERLKELENHLASLTKL